MRTQRLVLLSLSTILWSGLLLADSTTSSADNGDEVVQPKSSRSGGRVIEYGADGEAKVGQRLEAKSESNNQSDDPGFDRKQQTDSVTGSTEANAAKNVVSGTQSQQKNSVKLITGGDPTEGSAKVGRLPILD